MSETPKEMYNVEAPENEDNVEMDEQEKNRILRKIDWAIVVCAKKIEAYHAIAEAYDSHTVLYFTSSPSLTVSISVKLE